MSLRERGRRGSGRGRGGRAGHCPPTPAEQWVGAGEAGAIPVRGGEPGGSRWGAGLAPTQDAHLPFSIWFRISPHPPRSHRPWARSWAAGQGRAVSEALEVPVGSETWPPDSRPHVFQKLDGVLFLYLAQSLR